jgi:hypothetical protein
MFFSRDGSLTNRRLLRTTGFESLIDEVRSIEEPEGPVGFQWVLAKRRVEP